MSEDHQLENILSPLSSRNEASNPISSDVALRPRFLKDFLGQNSAKEQLKLFIDAATLRGETLDHLLLSGPPGLGKTTLSHIVAREMGAQLRLLSGPLLEKPAHLIGVLSHLKKNDVVFIDEIHRIHSSVEEYLYSAMEDFSIDILVDKGAHSRSVNLKIPSFTLIGATTKTGLLTAPLRSRFGVILRLDFYEPQDLQKIIIRSARVLNISIDEESSMEIAKRSRGTARIANRLLKRFRDYAQVRFDGCITKKIIQEASEMFCINEYGLDQMDQSILRSLIYKFNGGPVGLKTLSISVGENPDTLENVYEPYLLKQGFLQRTPAGRKATSLAYSICEVKDLGSAEPILF